MSKAKQEAEEVKKHAEEEAQARSDREKDRVEAYGKLCRDYVCGTVNDYYNELYRREKHKCDPLPEPSEKAVRARAGVGPLHFLSGKSKEETEEALRAARRELQKEAAPEKFRLWEQCEKENVSIADRLRADRDALAQGDAEQAARYFRHVLEGDYVTVDGDNRWEPRPSVRYLPDTKQLVIDYLLPTPENVPETQSWIVSKSNFKLLPQNYSRAEYLSIYEGVLFGLLIRVVGLAFRSDSRGILSEVVFNGQCRYSRGPQKPLSILSAACTAEEFAALHPEKEDFNCKAAAANRFRRCLYIGDVRSDRGRPVLLDNPPREGITPLLTAE